MKRLIAALILILPLTRSSLTRFPRSGERELVERAVFAEFIAHPSVAPTNDAALEYISTHGGQR